MTELEENFSQIYFCDHRSFGEELFFILQIISEILYLYSRCYFASMYRFFMESIFLEDENGRERRGVNLVEDPDENSNLILIHSNLSNQLKSLFCSIIFDFEKTNQPSLIKAL